jgi:carbonic anhydrase
MTKHLLSGHARFREEYFTGEAEFLRNLAHHGQRPSALYIGCCDSRVVPELLTASAPGELFVVRNIANVVPPAEHNDSSVGAAIEYAVHALMVPHIIVCGHGGCGGVKAAIEGIDQLAHLSSLHEWLASLAPAVKAARELTGPDDDLLRTAIEENVLDSMNNLISYSVVEQALAEGRIAMHGWVYDLAEGALHVYDVKTQEFVLADQLTKHTSH